MAVFGPRPRERSDINETYIGEILSVRKPGLFGILPSIAGAGTGRAHGYSIDELIEMEKEEIRKWSFVYMARIFFKSLRSVLVNTGRGRNTKPAGRRRGDKMTWRESGQWRGSAGSLRGRLPGKEEEVGGKDENASSPVGGSQGKDARSDNDHGLIAEEEIGVLREEINRIMKETGFSQRMLARALKGGIGRNTLWKINQNMPIAKQTAQKLLTALQEVKQYPTSEARMTTLRNEIIGLAREGGYSRRALARELGVSRKTLKKIERQGVWSPRIIERIETQIERIKNESARQRKIFKTFHIRIQEIKNSFGYSGQRIAKKLGVDQETLTKIERERPVRSWIRERLLQTLPGMEDDLIEGLVVEGVSENVKKDMIALLKEPAKFFYPLEAVKWWASRGYFRDEEAKAQALRWIKVRLQEAMKNEEIDSLPELSWIFSSRAPLEKRWTILKFLSEARRQDRNPARMIPLWFKRGDFKNRSVKNVILGYLGKGLVLPEEDEAEPEPDEDVPDLQDGGFDPEAGIIETEDETDDLSDTDYDKDDTASSPVGGPWQNSRDAMLEYEIAKVMEILRIRMGSFLGQFVFDELHHHGILEEMFDEIIQQLRPWEVQLLWDLREEMFGPHEMGEVIYEIVAQEIGFSMSRIVRMVFDRSARVESIVKILREVAAIIIEQGANVLPPSDITGFMETLKEIHREAKEEENITRSLFVSKMRHVYKGLRPMEEESLKEQALEKLFFDYTERIRLHVNEKREKGEAISFVPSSGREGGASSPRSPLGEAEGPRRGSSPVEFPEPFEINDEEGNLLTAHIGDITFRKSTHAVYLRENFVGKFEFEKESQGGVPWFVLSRVRIKPFWRGQGIAGQLIPWLVKKALREDAKVKIANIVNPLMVVMAQRLLSDIQAMVVVPPGELLAMETFSPVELFYLGGVVGEVGIRKGVITGSRMQDGYTVSIEGGRLNLLRQEGGIQEGPLHFMASGRRPLSGVNLGTLFGSAEIVDDRGLMRGLLYFNEDGSLDVRRSRWEENFSIEVRGFHIRAMDGQGKIYRLWRVSPRSVNLLGTPTQGHGGDQPSSSPVRNVNNSGSSASMPPVRRPAKEAGIDLWTVTKIETGEISRPTLQVTARLAAVVGSGLTAYGAERAFRDLMVRRKRLWLKRIRGEEIEIKPGEENGLTED